MICVEREFLLVPDAGQRSLIELTFDICDEIYNEMLHFCHDFYNKNGKCPMKKDANGYFNNMLLATHPQWKVADSHGIRGVVNDIVSKYYTSKGNLTPVSRDMYPRSYKTYTQTFSYDSEGERIKIPKLGYVHVEGQQKFKGDVKSIRIISEEPGVYYALVGDYMERKVLRRPVVDCK